MSERIFADAFAKWLREGGFLFRRDRMDKATTCEAGWPDFEIVGAGGRCIWLELKTAKGRLSAAQIAMHARFAKCGITVHVVRDLGAAQDLVIEWRRQLGAPTPVEPSSAPAGGCRIGVTPRWGSTVFDANGLPLRQATIHDLGVYPRRP